MGLPTSGTDMNSTPRERETRSRAHAYCILCATAIVCIPVLHQSGVIPTGQEVVNDLLEEAHALCEELIDVAEHRQALKLQRQSRSSAKLSHHRDDISFA